MRCAQWYLIVGLRDGDLRGAGSRGEDRRARAGVVDDDGDPCEERVQVRLADDEAVGFVLQHRHVGPSGGDDGTTADRARGVDSARHLAELLRRAHAAEAKVDGRLAGVEKRFQVKGQWTLVRQNPGAGLNDRAIRRIGPGPERLVGREPGPVAEHVTAYVAHGCQAHGCPMGVERGAERAGEAFGITSPKLAVVGRGGLRRLSPKRKCGRRVMRRWQNGEAVGGEDVADAHLLGHRARGDLQGRRGHDDVAALGRRRDRLELGRDRSLRHLTQLIGRGADRPRH